MRAQQNEILVLDVAQIKGDGTAALTHFHGHGNGRVVGVRVCAKHWRVAVHDGLAPAVHKACTKGHEHCLAFPAEQAGHVPHPGKFHVLQMRACLVGHHHGLACGGVLAVGGLPATHACGGNDYLGIKAVPFARDAVEAKGAADAISLTQEGAEQNAAHALHLHLLELLYKVLHHELAAATFKLGRVELHVIEAALAHELARSVLHFEELAAEALIVFETIAGAREDLLHELLVAQTVKVVDKVLYPLIHGVGIKHSLEVAAGHGHEAAPVFWALVHYDYFRFGILLRAAVGSPQACGTATKNEDIAACGLHWAPPPRALGMLGKTGGSSSLKG